jgi:hypothetical protein
MLYKSSTLKLIIGSPDETARPAFTNIHTREIHTREKLHPMDVVVVRLSPHVQLHRSRYNTARAANARWALVSVAIVPKDCVRPHHSAK